MTKVPAVRSFKNNKPRFSADENVWKASSVSTASHTAFQKNSKVSDAFGGFELAVPKKTTHQHVQNHCTVMIKLRNAMHLIDWIKPTSIRQRFKPSEKKGKGPKNCELKTCGNLSKHLGNAWLTNADTSTNLHWAELYDHRFGRWWDLYKQHTSSCEMIQQGQVNFWGRYRPIEGFRYGPYHHRQPGEVSCHIVLYTASKKTYKTSWRLSKNLENTGSFDIIC